MITAGKHDMACKSACVMGMHTRRLKQGTCRSTKQYGKNGPSYVQLRTLRVASYLALPCVTRMLALLVWSGTGISSTVPVAYSLLLNDDLTCAREVSTVYKRVNGETNKKARLMLYRLQHQG